MSLTIGQLNQIIKAEKRAWLNMPDYYHPGRERNAAQMQANAAVRALDGLLSAALDKETP